MSAAHERGESRGDDAKPDDRAGRSTARRWLRWLRVAIPVVAIGLIAYAAVGVGNTLAARSEWGWRGAYYPEREMEGRPTIRRDLQLRFQWFEAPPFPGGPEDSWSARWDTCLLLPEDQKLEVRLGSDDGSRLLVDGEPVVDLWGDHGFRWNTHNVDLARGVHHLRVDYYDKGGDAAIELKLIQPGLPAEPVPLEWLRVPETPLDADNVCSAYRGTSD